MQNSDRQRPLSEVVKSATFIHFQFKSDFEIFKVKVAATATVVIPQADADVLGWSGHAWFI
jgi:hypothetical protein